MLNSKVGKKAKLLADTLFMGKSVRHLGVCVCVCVCVCAGGVYTCALALGKPHIETF